MRVGYHQRKYCPYVCGCSNAQAKTIVLCTKTSESLLSSIQVVHKLAEGSKDQCAKEGGPLMWLGITDEAQEGVWRYHSSDDQVMYIYDSLMLALLSSSMSNPVTQHNACVSPALTIHDSNNINVPKYTRKYITSVY